MLHFNYMKISLCLWRNADKENNCEENEVERETAAEVL
jgi:hypothetical protein